MKSKHKLNPVQPLCAETRVDDGIDAKTLAKQDQPSHQDRKAHQVCRQAERAMSFVLAGEMGNELLHSLFVDAVDPAPDSSHLLVTISSYRTEETLPMDAVLAALKGAEGQFRAAVSAAINRKKAPQLSFQYRL